jgi:2-hydroxy-7-methoxy-5-methyl-1-naphthoate---CoA ligase
MSSSTAVPDHQTRTWPPELGNRYRELGYWEDTLLIDRILRAARKHPDREALVDGLHRWTYAELAQHVEVMATGLSATGFVPGDRVILQLHNCWEQVVANLACMRAGLIPVWALPANRHAEIRSLAEKTTARGIITLTRQRGVELQEQALAVADELSHLEHVIVVGADPASRTLPFAEILARGRHATRSCEHPSPAAGDDFVVLIPSGGTTGMSKIIPRTNNDLVYMIKQAVQICGFGPTSRYLAVLPLGHGFSNTGPGVLGTLMSGGCVIVCPSPSPEVALPLLRAERVTVTSVVPAIVHRWLTHLSESDGQTPALDVIQVGAARLEPGVGKALEEAFGCRLQQVYGMAEGLVCFTRLDDPEAVVLSTQGRPASEADELKVVTDDGVEVPLGEEGVLLTRGPYTIRGYYRDPKLNGTAFLEDGWYRTGDLVRIGTDGNVTITGREKDVINRGGEKISAEEVELAARTYPGIVDCAAVSLPHDELGEEVCLVVVTHGAPLPTVADLASHLARAGLATFKAPKTLVPIDSIPLTGIGKVDKRWLRSFVQASTRAGTRVPAST